MVLYYADLSVPWLLSSCTRCTFHLYLSWTEAQDYPSSSILHSAGLSVNDWIKLNIIKHKIREELGHISHFVPSLQALKNKKKLCFLKPWLLSQLPKINFYVPFLPPLKPFGLNCLNFFLSLFLKWTISPSRHLFLTSICTAVPFHVRKPETGLLSWWLSEESSCLISALNLLLTLLCHSLEVPPNLSSSLRQALTPWPQDHSSNCLQLCSRINQKCTSEHRLQKVQAEVQLPKIFVERQ